MIILLLSCYRSLQFACSSPAVRLRILCQLALLAGKHTGGPGFPTVRNWRIPRLLSHLRGLLLSLDRSFTSYSASIVSIAHIHHQYHYYCSSIHYLRTSIVVHCFRILRILTPTLRPRAPRPGLHPLLVRYGATTASSSSLSSILRGIAFSWGFRLALSLRSNWTDFPATEYTASNNVVPSV